MSKGQGQAQERRPPESSNASPSVSGKESVFENATRQYLQELEVKHTVAGHSQGMGNHRGIPPAGSGGPPGRNSAPNNSTSRLVNARMDSRLGSQVGIPTATTGLISSEVSLEYNPMRYPLPERVEANWSVNTSGGSGCNGNSGYNGSSTYNNSMNSASRREEKDSSKLTLANFQSKFSEVQSVSTANIGSQFLLLFPEVFNCLVIARFAQNPDSLAAVGLGNCIFNCIALAFPLGLNAGLDTFVSTAVGAENYRMMYIYLGQAQLIQLLCIPIVYTIFMTEIAHYSMVNLLGQDPSVSVLAASFCRSSTFGVGLWYLADVYRKFYMNIGRPQDIYWSQLCITALHGCWAYIFVGIFELENFGLGLANSCTYTLYLITWHFQYVSFNKRFLDPKSDGFLQLLDDIDYMNKPNNPANRRSSSNSLARTHSIEKKGLGKPLLVPASLERLPRTSSKTNKAIEQLHRGELKLFWIFEVLQSKSGTASASSRPAYQPDDRSSLTPSTHERCFGTERNTRDSSDSRIGNSTTTGGNRSPRNPPQYEVWNTAALGKYLEIAGPAAAAVFLEWALWEIMALLAGWIGPAALACQVAVINFYTLLFTVPMGVSSSAAYFVGKALGELLPGQAKLYGNLCILSNLFFFVIVLALGYVFKEEIVSMYFPFPADFKADMHKDRTINEVSSVPSSSSAMDLGTSSGPVVSNAISVGGGILDPINGYPIISSPAENLINSLSKSLGDVLDFNSYFERDDLIPNDDLVAKRKLTGNVLFLVFAGTLPWDSVAFVGQGILRACGWANVSMWIFILQHYVFGFALAWYWTIRYKSLALIWVALVLDVILGCIAHLYIIYCKLDYPKEAEIARIRLIEQERKAAAEEEDTRVVEKETKSIAV